VIQSEKPPKKDDDGEKCGAELKGEVVHTEGDVEL